ncbi:MAG: hypothetical protein HYX48_07445 [Chlamydiales bacterium]|nr:hypothetical protein [Chlamydiales bacterium]
MIKIAARFHPYSHLPGASCLIPKSLWQIQAYPTLLEFKSLQSAKTFSLQMDIRGPVKNFTLEQDLERGKVYLFGESVKGYFRLSIQRVFAGIEIHFERIPGDVITCHSSDSRKAEQIKRGTLLLLPLDYEHPIVQLPQERLSLGTHKAQDWDLVSRRLDLQEIAPVWMRLGLALPEIKESKQTGGTLLLLDECQKILASGKREEIGASFQRAFLAGFSSVMLPRLQDDLHQGILPIEEKIPANVTPLQFLKKGALLIRSLFFQEEGSEISLLPHLPPEFFAGRFVGIRRANGDQIDFEWSKKLLHKVVFRSSQEQEITLNLQKPLRRFRLRHSERGRGETIAAGEKIRLRPHEKIFLDRFEK